MWRWVCGWSDEQNENEAGHFFSQTVHTRVLIKRGREISSWLHDGNLSSLISKHMAWQWERCGLDYWNWCCCNSMLSSSGVTYDWLQSLWLLRWLWLADGNARMGGIILRKETHWRGHNIWDNAVPSGWFWVAESKPVRYTEWAHYFDVKVSEWDSGNCSDLPRERDIFIFREFSGENQSFR